MKRILPAVLLAILFHVFLFLLDPGWFTKKTGEIKKPAITVTMSYKKKLKPPPVKKPPKEIKKKVKVIKKIKTPDLVKVEKQVLKPEPIKNEIIEEKAETVEEEIVVEEVVTTEKVQEIVEEPVSMIITEAVPLYKVNPEPGYPKRAKKRGFEGTVILSVLVNKKGAVDNIWIFESCGYKSLDNAALKAVKGWIFEPGRRRDETVEMWVEVPVRFELK